MAAGTDLSARLQVLCSAYGRYPPRDVVDAAIALIDTERTQTEELATRGLAPWTAFAEQGGLDAFAAEADWIRANRSSLLEPSGGPSRDRPE